MSESLFPSRLLALFATNVAVLALLWALGAATWLLVIAGFNIGWAGEWFFASLDRATRRSLASAQTKPPRGCL